MPISNPLLQSRHFSATDALRNAVMVLQQAHIETASLDARLLLQHVLGVSWEQLLVRSGLSLNSAQMSQYQALIEKRAHRQPLSQLVGNREFWGLAFKVTPATLDPRPDSETLIEALLKYVKRRGAAHKVLDLGTGTGCLLLSLLTELPHATGTGVDISEEALAVARENAQALGLEQRAGFIRSCWGDEVKGQFDIIVANPPYIPTDDIALLAPEVALFEPRLALDGGEDGLDCYRAILQQLPGMLAKDGVAAFEIGIGQQQALYDLIRQQGLKLAREKEDLAGITRCILITH